MSKTWVVGGVVDPWLDRGTTKHYRGKTKHCRGTTVVCHPPKTPHKVFKTRKKHPCSEKTVLFRTAMLQLALDTALKM